MLKLLPRENKYGYNTPLTPFTPLNSKSVSINIDIFLFILFLRDNITSFNPFFNVESSILFIIEDN